MKVLIIEDEKNISSVISKGLAQHHIHSQAAFDGEVGLDLLRVAPFDLIILDIILPKVNGWEVCRQIRQELKLSTPILMLSALGHTEHVVKGLDAGADDFLAKPFKIDELAARVRALYRRNSQYSPVSAAQIRAVNLELDLNRMQVRRGQENIPLTAREFELLKCFMQNPERVLTREELLDAAWGISFDTGTNVVDVYINYLRRKLESGGQPRVIHTKIGAGYYLGPAAQ
ncbi:response regulator transcription factor [Phaeodactylibacter luteus]|uniref:Response regulator transcription factor n=1 Tax=Phaeodactylibacter luteus TaxID=1564516 RepID=A0A5C6RLP3_9BACT|nr:response regulator transcription factor [Phaeodactylibacter luteus]TXB62242.1 response regulator transcription factor [Phaeodactylibacter luteus]